MKPEDESPTTLHVARARNGDLESITWLVERFSPLIRSQARYRLGPRLRELYDPDDLVNDVWLAVLPSLADLSPRDGRYTPVLLKYMSRVVVFRVNNLISKHISGKPITQRFDGNDMGGLRPEALPDETAGVLTRILERESRDLVREAIDRLGERDRELLVLRGIEGLQYREIAKLLETDHKVLAVQYQRALAKLRRALPDSVFDELEDD